MSIVARVLNAGIHAGKCFFRCEWRSAPGMGLTAYSRRAHFSNPIANYKILDDFMLLRDMRVIGRLRV